MRHVAGLGVLKRSCFHRHVAMSCCAHQVRSLVMNITLTYLLSSEESGSALISLSPLPVSAFQNSIGGGIPGQVGTQRSLRKDK